MQTNRKVGESCLDVNREENFSLSESWKPLIQILKEQKKAISEEK
jgi:hypothetical protein